MKRKPCQWLKSHLELVRCSIVGQKALLKFRGSHTEQPWVYHCSALRAHGDDGNVAVASMPTYSSLARLHHPRPIPAAAIALLCMSTNILSVNTVCLTGSGSFPPWCYQGQLLRFTPVLRCCELCVGLCTSKYATTIGKP